MTLDAAITAVQVAAHERDVAAREMAEACMAGVFPSDALCRKYAACVARRDAAVVALQNERAGVPA